MISLPIILTLVWLHFVADFLLQNDWMALNKSKRYIPLFVHVIVYSFPFLIFGWQYALINGIAHFATDWGSSRATSWLYAKQQRHWFFVVIGLDQSIHLTTLFVTYLYMV